MTSTIAFLLLLLPTTGGMVENDAIGTLVSGSIVIGITGIKHIIIEIGIGIGCHQIQDGMLLPIIAGTMD